MAFEISRLHLQAAAENPLGSSFGYPNLNVLSGRYSGPPSPSSSSALALKQRTQNMTECVPVPSSEHVAEIVGKQGCKIKALRTKTNTYIKTPVRGEEPVFVITGRREDVEIAKAEIVQAAEHFTQIRAQRRLHPPPHIPGQMTIQMPVPLRLVGLIVGPKGQTIKKVQQDTATYIITPGRDKDPVFEITGCGEGVQRAKELIEDHVLARTGNTLEELLIQQNDPTRQRSSSLDNACFGVDIWRDHERLFGGSPDDLSGDSNKNEPLTFEVGCWNVEPEPETTTNMSGGGSVFFPPNKNQRSFSIAGLGSGGLDATEHTHARRLNSDPMPSFGIWNSSSNIVFRDSSDDFGSFFGSGYSNAFGSFNKTSLNSTGDSACSTSPAESVTSQKAKRDCIVCQDNERIAALVPCGHNLFCVGCARAQQKCPICHQHVETFIRIQADV